MLKNIKKRLAELIQSQQFNPAWWGVLVNPFYISRRGLSEAIRSSGGTIEGKTLDIGCGQKPYRALCASSEYIGLELDTEESRARDIADVFYDGSRLPFGEGEFDSVVSHEVFEHVFTPGFFLKEVNRVLRPGGTLMMTVPFVWDEHCQPHDFARYTSFAMRALMQEHGFEVLHQEKTVHDFSLIFQLINAYSFKTLHTGNGYWNQISCLLFMAPVTIIGVFLGRILPSNEDLYLDNVVVARKVA